MRIVKTIVTGATAINLLMSAALAQQTMTGTITKIDRIHSTIAIQQMQSGTVGANTGGATEEYKVQDRAQLEAFHAGDKVTYAAADSGGIKTITKLQQQ
jgi:Cu/Ag efflux protein CusF